MYYSFFARRARSFRCRKIISC